MSDMGSAGAAGKFKPFNSKFLDRPVQKTPEQKFRDVSDMYEKHFLREMTKAMRSTVHEGGFIQSNQAEKIFREQLDDHYVEKWGERGGIGLSDLIYKQLVDKFGAMMGLKNNFEGSNFSKPQGPLPLDKNSESKIEYRAQPFQHPGKRDAVSYRIDVVGEKKSFGSENSELKNTETNQPVSVPWDGVLLGKKSLVDNQVMIELQHDNGLKSQLVYKSKLSQNETGIEVGQKLQAGDTLGFLGADAKSLYWTVEKSEPKPGLAGPETVSE